MQPISCSYKHNTPQNTDGRCVSKGCCSLHVEYCQPQNLTRPPPRTSLVHAPAPAPAPPAMYPAVMGCTTVLCHCWCITHTHAGSGRVRTTCNQRHQHRPPNRHLQSTPVLHPCCRHHTHTHTHKSQAHKTQQNATKPTALCSNEHVATPLRHVSILIKWPPSLLTQHPTTYAHPCRSRAQLWPSAPHHPHKPPPLASPTLCSADAATAPATAGTARLHFLASCA